MKSLVVDYRISEEEEEVLSSMNYNIIKCPRCSLVSKAIDGHPDIQVNILKNNIAIVQNHIPRDFISSLLSIGYKVIPTKNSLKSSYPFDIILNAVCSDGFFLHSLKYTDESLLNYWKLNCDENTSHKRILLNVKQGYTKCSTAVIRNNAFITSDKGIAKVLTSQGMDVLSVPPGDIILPGMNYGFIGGCCGLIEDNLIAFYGDLNNYVSGEQIIDFLKFHNIGYISLGHGKLVDRGSILRL